METKKTKRFLTIDEKLFNIVAYSANNSLKNKNFIEELNDSNDFLIEEFEENRIYRIFTLNYVAEVTCTVDMGDESKTHGTWSKSFSIEEISKNYYNKNYFGVDRIVKHIKDLFYEKA